MERRQVVVGLFSPVAGLTQDVWSSLVQFGLEGECDRLVFSLRLFREEQMLPGFSGVSAEGGA